MLAANRFHSETPNVIDPGESAPSRPSRPDDDDDDGGGYYDREAPTRTFSNGSMSSHGSSSNSKDYVYKPPLPNSSYKVDYNLAEDMEPYGGGDGSEDDAEYGFVSRADASSSSPDITTTTSSRKDPEALDRERALLYAATVINESEKREKRRSDNNLSPVRRIWNGAARRSYHRPPEDDLVLLRKAVDMDHNDGLMWGGEQRESSFQRKGRCFNRLIILLAVAGIVIAFGLAASSALGSRGGSAISSRMEATINVLSDAGISTRQDLTKTSSPQHLAALWIADNDPEQVGVPSMQVDDSRFVQRYVLALLYYAWEGSNWINGLKFISEDHECSWFESVKDENGDPFALGVACDDELRVENLLIPSNGLKGSIPKEIRMLTQLDFLSLKHNDLTGTLPHALSRLSNLDYLDLKFNQLTGSVPEFLGDLPLLEVLGLSKNSFEGTLPDDLANLPLITLAIDDNMLTGDLTSLSSISTLAYLYAEDNDFGGSLDQGFFTGLHGLIETDLSGNRFTATDFPVEVFSLPQLRVLDLASNEIKASLPEDIPNNNVLEYLNLRLNSVSSSIPDSISNLGALTHLDLESNNLTGNIPEQSVAALDKLTYLFLGKNPFVGGAIPEAFQSLTALRELSLDDTQLEGGIPMWIEQLTDLRLLDLRHNQLTGTIEDIDFTKLNSLTFLLLSNNELVGQIPDTLTSLNNLAVVALHHNGFIGDATGICAADDDSTVQIMLTTDCGAVECDCCDKCCDGDSCYEGLVWDSLENNKGSWEEHFKRADYSFNPHILFDNRL